ESVETENEFQYNVTYENKKGTHLMKKYHSSIKQLEITPEFAKFIGLYYGDGNLIRTAQQGIVGINITCATKAQNIVEFVQYISKKYFNIEPKIYTSHSKDGRSWIKCSIHSRILGILFKELFGHYFDQKKIYEGMYDWDKSLLDGLLAGIVSSDGNVTKVGDVRFQMANCELVKELFGIFKKNNYNIRLAIARQNRKKLNGEKRATQYRVDFGTNNQLLKYITKSYDDNRLELVYNTKQRFIIKIGNDYFYKVQSITKSSNTDNFVYDLEVEDDHSYCVEGLIVHNCNLTALIADETNSILSTLNDISLASRDGAGIGLHLHNLRSERSIVSSFNGAAGGVVRFADMVQSHMRFFKQGNRSGSAALYLGVWHRDIIEFLSLRLPTGDEKLRTRDLFTAVCLPDIFMEKLKAGEEYWYTFCPNDIVKAGLTPLHELWGDQFKEAYNKYVELGLGHPILIREIWDLMIRAQVEGGMPYTFFWDNANRENHQKHIGVITGSNLCVSGDSVLSTIDGERHIDDLVGQKVKIWNGEEFSESLVAKTGENKELYKVTVEINGSELRSLKCTAEHKWYLMNYSVLKEYEVTTDNLSEGDTLTPYFDPNILVTIFAKVISIDKLEGLHDTYCVNEPINHKAMFNGILTGNCIEITEVTKANYTAQCCLGSINLANNLSTETLIGSVRSLTKFLNRVIDKNEWATEGARIAGLDQRALAIGVSGMADHLAMKKMNYEDSASYQESIIETIYKTALNTS
ncbi:MAG TPA: hypothetical protein P5513_06750, partial [Candidatus Diapherotrites archaeon]|nr:hypothetical protein [Candidatus Diapherotrites archaeon]